MSAWDVWIDARQPASFAGILDADGHYQAPPPSIFDVAIGQKTRMGALLPVIEALAKNNPLLQDARWHSSRFFDQFGRRL